MSWMLFASFDGSPGAQSAKGYVISGHPAGSEPGVGYEVCCSSAGELGIEGLPARVCLSLQDIRHMTGVAIRERESLCQFQGRAKGVCELR